NRIAKDATHRTVRADARPDIREGVERVHADERAAERSRPLDEPTIQSSRVSRRSSRSPNRGMNGNRLAGPSPCATNGQNWGLPPIDPRALRRDRYRYFVRLV